MIKGVYHALRAVADQPIGAWEALRDGCQVPKEREHIAIAIEARKRMEKARGVA